MSKMTLWGFDGSTYVRTIKMLLADSRSDRFNASHSLYAAAPTASSAASARRWASTFCFARWRVHSSRVSGPGAAT